MSNQDKGLSIFDDDEPEAGSTTAEHGRAANAAPTPRRPR